MPSPRTLILALPMILLFACAPRQETFDNVFISKSSPSLRIEMDNGFEYSGTRKSSPVRQGTTGSRNSYHYYVDIGDKPYVAERIVIIGDERLPPNWYWTSIPPSEDGNLRTGEREMLGTTFRYGVRLSRLGRNTVEEIEPLNWLIPGQSYLMQDLWGITASRAGTQIRIFRRLESDEGWTPDYASLPQHLKDIVREFEANALDEFMTIHPN